MILQLPDDPQELVNAAQRSIDKLFPGSAETIDQLMRMQYLRLSLVTNTFRDLPGMEVMDIACGAREGELPPHVKAIRLRVGKMYEAWFARFAAVCGAKVTGLDRRQSSGENYNHVVVDIRDPDTFKQFDDETFNIVNTSAFLVSPKRVDTDAGGALITDPDLLFEHHDDFLHILDEHVNEQVTRILRENGWYLYNESIYEKRHGELHLAPRALLLAQKGFPPTPERQALGY